MEPGSATQVELQPRHALQVLGTLVVLLLVAHIGSQVLRAQYGPEFAKAMVRLFNVDGEGNLPTLFSTALLSLNSLLFYFAWRAGAQTKSREPFWLVMCVVFLFLGIDEIGALHERIIRPLREILPGTAGGLFRFAWVVPYGVAAIVFAALALPVLKRIGMRQGALFAVAGIFYLGGALGMEMISGRYLEMSHHDALDATPVYVMLTTIEEGSEMTGLVLCIYALLTLLQQDQHGGFSISLARGPARKVRAGAGNRGDGPPSIAASAMVPQDHVTRVRTARASSSHRD